MTDLELKRANLMDAIKAFCAVIEDHPGDILVSLGAALKLTIADRAYLRAVLTEPVKEGEGE